MRRLYPVTADPRPSADTSGGAGRGPGPGPASHTGGSWRGREGPAPRSRAASSGRPGPSTGRVGSGRAGQVRAGPCGLCRPLTCLSREMSTVFTPVMSRFRRFSSDLRSMTRRSVIFLLSVGGSATAAGAAGAAGAPAAAGDGAAAAILERLSAAAARTMKPPPAPPRARPGRRVPGWRPRPTWRRGAGALRLTWSRDLPARGWRRPGGRGVPLLPPGCSSAPRSPPRKDGPGLGAAWGWALASGGSGAESHEVPRGGAGGGGAGPGRAWREARAWASAEEGRCRRLLAWDRPEESSTLTLILWARLSLVSLQSLCFKTFSLCTCGPVQEKNNVS